MNRYYFSISAQFLDDYDVSSFEKILGYKAYKLTYLKDSLGPTPSAKYFYKTQEFDEEYTDEVFEKFVDTLYTKALKIKNEIDNNNGKLTLCIVFTHFVEKPCLFLSNKTISQLSEMGASFDVDFIN